MKHKYIQFVSILFAILPIQAALSEEMISGMTTPSADITLSFLQAGRIDKIHIKEGQQVIIDQPLMAQYDAIERTQLLKMEELSQDTTQVDAAEAKLAQKKTDLKKMEWAGQRGAVSELDIEHAVLEVKIAELTLGLSKLEHRQLARQYEEAKIKVDNMLLKSPVNGFIEELAVQEGESVQALEKTIRIVRTDPLWVDVRIPLKTAYSIHVDDIVKVAFPEPHKAIVSGKIIFIGLAGDAASDTLKARLEVANPNIRPSGERVMVDFSNPEKAEKAKKEPVDPNQK